MLKSHTILPHSGYIIKDRTLSSGILFHLSKVYLDFDSCRPISPSSHTFISLFSLIKINASPGRDMEEKGVEKEISTPCSRCAVDMCRTGFHKKVIVWLNCALWIVTVGSERRVLPGSPAGPSLALMLQRFHSCHRLIVLPITHNYPWQRQRHSEMLTKDATFLTVWSGKMRMLQSCLGTHREEEHAINLL